MSAGIETDLRGAKKIIRASVELGQPAILMGSPGIGKTEVIEQVAKELGIGFRCFEASSLDPMDVRGVLIPDGEATYFTKSPLLPDVKKHGERGILLIDELPSGLPATQVALHSLFHPKERRLGEFVLPDGWIPMATGNYASDGAGATQLLSAIGDRVNILNVKEDFDVWKEDYALPNNVHPIVLGFLNWKETAFCTFNDRTKGGKGKSFVTPRTHTLISNVFHYAETKDSNLGDEELLTMLAGYAGDGIATEYIGFRKTYMDLPDPNAIYRGEDILPDREDPSITFALCSALAAKMNKVTEAPLKMPKSKAIKRMLNYCQLLDAEFGGLLIKDLYVTHRDDMLKCPEFEKVAERYF